MIHKKIQLDDNVFLEVFAANPIGDYVRNAILVIPGGGYGGLSLTIEGEPIAQAFMPHGYNAFVLHYSVRGKKTYPGQLIEASLAMKHIKDNAKEYNIDPDRVFVTGFSAGGHLAASLGTMWHKKEIYNQIDMPYGYNKPKGMMLVYPVISSDPEFGHLPSLYNLLDSQTPDKDLLEECSIEKNVDENSAPAYIIHTVTDSVVNVRNSIALADAFAKKGLLFELHIYPDAPHGFGLANEITENGNKKNNNPCIAKWVENAVLWANLL